MSLARGMADTLEHRGPDSSGHWVDAEAGVALGHRRLAIIDLTESGHQPMTSSSGRWVVTYNGEIYNFDTLRGILEAEGITFRGASDTEVLLEAIDRWGVSEAITRCRGMFALAVWDRAARELHLSRDRVGEKPLFYGWAGDTLLFGSELKALRAHPDFDPSIDRDSVALYLRYGYIPGPYSVYEGVRKVPAGCIVTVREDGNQSEAKYWDFRSIVTSRHEMATPEESVDELEARLRTSVRRQMVSDVPLGAFLSGGIDSSTIVALMQEQSVAPIKTFSVGFEEFGFDEAAYARKVAGHLGTDHTELYVTAQDALAVVPSLSSMYDEPFGDSSQIPTSLVSGLARRSVTVALSGDGGDELFGGYSRYERLDRTWRAVHKVSPRPRRALAAALSAVPAAVWAGGRAAVSRLVGERRAAGLPSPRAAQTLAEVLKADTPFSSYEMLVSHWRRPEEVVLDGVEKLVPYTDVESWPAFGDIVSWAMYVDALQYLPDDILVKVDRASMAESLEVRVPMLDPEVIEWAWSMPPDVRRLDGRAKWPLRQVLYRHVPAELVDRPKMGFGVPIHSWLRGPLRSWAEDLLDPVLVDAQGILDSAQVQRVWREHLSGFRSHEYLLWDVLMLQSWLAQPEVL